MPGAVLDHNKLLLTGSIDQALMAIELVDISLNDRESVELIHKVAGVQDPEVVTETGTRVPPGC